MTRRRWILVASLVAIAAPVSAQQVVPAANGASRHIVAVRATTPIRLDGALDEETWRQAEPQGDFIQSEPREGAPATERTEVRVAYDERALYIAAECFDREPDRLVVNDITKDFVTTDSDMFGVVIDGFLDRKNGFLFITNPRGARFDQQVANEGRDLNANWDGVWSVSTAITKAGWALEMEIPLKTLRFAGGTRPAWGINFARRIRRKNELVFWSPVPRRWNLYRTAYAGVIEGLQDLQPGRNVRFKPFALASSKRPPGAPTYDAELGLGLDVKYGVTPALTLDVTVKTDFSQVEADLQQVNLTRYSLYFPEKREFFLENAGIFQFGEVPRRSQSASTFRPPEEEAVLFFSRRIGLSDQGELISLAGGARVTGRAGPYTIGVIDLQAERATVTGAGGARAESPATNFLVARLKRDVLANSDVGIMFLNKEATGRSDRYNRVAGIDGNFRFHENWTVNGFISRSMSPASVRAGDDQTAGKITAGYESNLFQTGYGYMDIGDDFRDEVGFLKRVGVRKHFVEFNIRPRPTKFPRLNRVLREAHPHLRVGYFNDQHNRLVTKESHFGFSFYLQNGAEGEAAWNPGFDRLRKPFAVRRNVAVAPGDYSQGYWSLRFDSDKSRAVASALRLETGDFYDGRRSTFRASVTLRPSYRISLSAALEHNDVAVTAGSFTTDLMTIRGVYAFSTNMFLNALLQYNTDVHQASANVRFNLIHHPLSDLFLVYNEQRPTAGTPVTTGREVTLKFTHVLSF